MYEQAFHPGDLSGYKFLVTGGAGFIGSNLVEYLMRWNAGKVRVLDNLATGFHDNLLPFLHHPNFEWVEGDICLAEDCTRAMKDIDFVLHQAALGSVPRSVKDPVSTNNANVNGFLNILVAAKEAGVKRIVYASSSSVYGDSKALPKREDNIGKPLSPYAVSKLVDEHYAGVFSRIYGMEIIGLRYFNIFGPRQNPSGPYAAAIPLFMEALLKNQPAYINGDGGQTRDFTFVQNAVQANIKALFSLYRPEIEQIYNVAVSERISIKELFNILKDLTGSEHDAIHREEREGDIKDSLADISKAQTHLGYQPAIRMREGLSITLEWFKKNMI
jgi:UDP-N-acetylglucosamine 4-epimerase